MSPPFVATGNIDTKATTNGGDIYASRILVEVAPNTKPSAPTRYDVPFRAEESPDATPDLDLSATDPDGTAGIIYPLQKNDELLFGSVAVDCTSDAACAT